MSDWVMVEESFLVDLIDSIEHEELELSERAEENAEASKGQRDLGNDLSMAEYEARAQAYKEAQILIKDDIMKKANKVNEKYLEIDEDLAHHFKKLKEVDDMRRGENGKDPDNK